MIDLTSHEEITNLCPTNLFPIPCLSFISDYMILIRVAFEDEAFPPPGHWFFILEATDELDANHDDHLVFTCAAGTYYPEYIERYTFNDGSCLYKIYVLLDNESSITFFTIKDIHSVQVECWLIANSEEGV
ncbi:hypothetical protein ACFOQM_06335 [Paenibacillus sp. GCM10012307]|uniref:Uncharacterized protein n=1 Tax=Paenibacillus roseus TaxID=2798579 RepID=A0A934IX54_9BACL|nr:hypothetical protein [Paenibacillus roseus]MBJ6360917.1 hypothetical protein [Paenibacillus roseus]